MKKVIIAGASVYGLENISDDCMLYAFCNDLQKKISDLQITLIARHPSEKLDNLLNVKSIKNLDHSSREESKGALV